MALTDEGMGTTMLVQPTNGMNNGGFGFGDGSGWWIILLLLVFGGGWGNGYGNNGGSGLYPWMNQSNQINDGFRDQMINGTINGIQNGITTGFGDIQTALCGGFAGVNSAITSAQMAALERSFAAQTAQTAGMTALQSQMAQCCCDNRAGIADLRYTVATEACADRSAVNDALRDVLAANTASTQRILDQMCSDKIDAKNEKIAELQNQLTMAQLAASQNAQTAQIIANNEAQTTALEQYLAPVPRPAYMVQNPNCCTGGCGNF